VKLKWVEIDEDDVWVPTATLLHPDGTPRLYKLMYLDQDMQEWAPVEMQW